MFLKTIFLLLFSLHFSNGFSQILSAQLLDLVNKPIPGVKVFYDKSTIFTYTNNDGVFEIPRLSEILNPKLVFYHPNHDIYEVSNTKELKSIYYLKRKTEDIEFASNHSSNLFTPEEMTKVFVDNFLGETENTKETKILNKEVIHLHFDTINYKFTAKASQPLQIQNNALGIHIEYFLEDFEIEFSAYSLQPEYLDYKFNYGFSLFKDIDTTKTKIKERQKAYKGTINHFFQQYINQDYNRSKYKVYGDDKRIKLKKLFSVEEIEEDTFKLRLGDDIVNSGDQEEFAFYIQQYYKNQKTNRAYYYNQIGMPYYQNKSNRVLLYKPYILVDKNGNVINQDDIEISGNIIEIDIADMLPINFNVIDGK